MRVRIVEDSRDLQWLYRVHLEAEGFEVEATWKDFVDLLDEEAWRNIDVAILDILLRDEITGLDILRWLKKHLPHIRRVVLSAVATMDAEIAELADEYLTKPADPHALVVALGTGHV